MSKVLDYIYQKPVDIDEGSVYQLLAASHSLCLPGLRELCSNFLVKKLDIKNCVGIMTFAR
jgi:hypothetical protein